jgi:hypothetical protein
MVDYNPERASREIGANLYAWTSCQRLVDMSRSVHRPYESTSRYLIGATKT